MQRVCDDVPVVRRKNNTDLIGICPVFINDEGRAKNEESLYRYERDCVRCRAKCATFLNGARACAGWTTRASTMSPGRMLTLFVRGRHQQ